MIDDLTVEVIGTLDFEFRSDISDSLRRYILSHFLIDPDPNWMMSMFIRQCGAKSLYLACGDAVVNGSGGDMLKHTKHTHTHENGLSFDLDGINLLQLEYMRFILEQYGHVKCSFPPYFSKNCIKDVTIEMELRDFDFSFLSEEDEYPEIFAPFIDGENFTRYWETCLPIDDTQFAVEYQGFRFGDSFKTKYYVESQYHSRMFHPIFREILIRSYFGDRLPIRNSISVTRFDIKVLT